MILLNHKGIFAGVALRDQGTSSPRQGNAKGDRIMARRRIGIAAAGLVASWACAFTAAAQTQTQTVTGTLTVTATVESSCSISGGTLAFRAYGSGQSTDLDAQGQIDYTNCPTGTLTFELDNGQNANGTQRRMRSGSNFLVYEIFRNAGRTLRWGSGSEANAQQLLAAGNGSVPVYGRIPRNQSVPPGSYSDTITITLRF
ncbi:MAG: spore coat U domain-containing protein [Geminicoccaceae bacterium]|nr:spore coat U domain-containing protein [Geminicoccaceae bacterium]